MIIWIIVFIASLMVLIKSSSSFVDSAEKIGLSLGISPFIIGISLVAAGTSLPELASSIIAVLEGSPEIVAGNVTGSNITNIFLILGITVIISKKININYEIGKVDIPLLVFSAFLFTVTVWDGVFNLYEALICIGGLVIYLSYTATNLSKEKQDSLNHSKLLEQKLKKISEGLENLNFFERLLYFKTGCEKERLQKLLGKDRKFADFLTKINIKNFLQKNIHSKSCSDIKSSCFGHIIYFKGHEDFKDKFLQIIENSFSLCHTLTLLEESQKKSPVKIPVKNFIILLISGFFIYLGAKYTVDSVIKLSEIFNIGKEIIATSAVAIGTSLPELMVNISAGKKGNFDIVVGSILGSNIFNTFAVMGIPALFGNLPVSSTILTLGLPVMLMATGIFVIIAHDRELTLWDGWMALLFYSLFIEKLFNYF